MRFEKGDPVVVVGPITHRVIASGTVVGYTPGEEMVTVECIVDGTEVLVNYPEDRLEHRGV